MNPDIQFQSASGANMTITDLQEPLIDKQQLSTDALPVVTTLESSLLRRSVKGKLPRLVVSAAREQSDTQYRSRMQEARVILGQEFYSDSAKTLASVRLSRGLSQQQLAKAIGTSQPAIAKIEAGSINILLSTAKRLASALGLNLIEIDAVLTATSKNEHTEA